MRNFILGALTVYSIMATIAIEMQNQELKGKEKPSYKPYYTKEQ